MSLEIYLEIISFKFKMTAPFAVAVRFIHPLMALLVVVVVTALEVPFLFHVSFTFFFRLAENRCLELHSPDGVHSCILRAADSAEALVWFNALHSAMSGSTQRALVEANRALMNVIGELKHIGWLSRRLSGSSGAGSASNASGGAGNNAMTGTTTSAGSGGEVVSCILMDCLLFLFPFPYT